MSRTKREMPTFFSFEIGPIRSLAESMTDEEWGRWSKNALNDLSIGCVKKDTDPRVIAVFEKAKGNMDKEYQRKSKWYQNHVGNANDKQEKEQKHNETQPKPQAAEMKIMPGQLVWGQFENVFLTQEQFNELARNVGNLNKARELVENLSAGLADGSKESKNHFATLTHWANYRKSKAEEDENSGTRYESVTEHNRRVSEKADREIRQMKEMGLI